LIEQKEAQKLGKPEAEREMRRARDEEREEKDLAQRKRRGDAEDVEKREKRTGLKTGQYTRGLHPGK
jgi:hypothetical protein